MGITWRFTMVLLSTLAALVIIVHSAEEEYENQYRRGLRPRALDTGTRRYEQPWRTLEVEPIQQQSTSRAELEDTSSEEPPRRRRPGRKRKRRPEPTSEEDVSSNERFTYFEDRERPHFEDLSNERQTSQMPKRRRKKIERRLKWADSLEEDRPTRRRGQRRKRPSKEIWPELSEFNDFRPKEASRNVDEEVSTDQIMTMNEDKHGDIFSSTMQYKQKNFKDYMESREDVFELDEKIIDKISDKEPNDFRQESIYTAVEKEDGFRIKTPVVNDKSLSEFSYEVPEEYKTDEAKRKNDEKKNVMTTDYLKDMEKAQVTGSIDPLTLKDILKQSNGTSLSEILQQHNLSLADLLHGKELALSILKSENPGKSTQHTTTKPSNKLLITKPTIVNSAQQESSEEKLLQHTETKYVTEPITETPDNPTTFLSTQNDEDDLVTEIAEISTTVKPITEETTKKINTRRFPTANRRKQRIRPVITNNYKSQLNRDMLALTARKYFYNNSRRRNTTKSQEWKDVIPLMKNNTTNDNTNIDKPNNETTASSVVVEDTITQTEKNDTTVSSIDNNNISNDTNKHVIDKEVSQNKTQEAKTEDIKLTNDLDNTKLLQSTTPINASGLRRQAFNNILKKKRRKQKNLTTEPPQAQDDFMKNLFGMPNLVSSSEFIERTQGPKSSLDDVTILDDFITTEMPSHLKNKSRKNRLSTISPTTYRQIFIPSSTEESAKVEIEEILNDTLANARLSKILMERNMTLNELVEHRERGSSHVHLADIFHNASKEPNPPEPFLSKSAIEPISKETYPLRALLDANIHETTTKVNTMDTDDFIHIPMKMDFGSNVNENAETMGIISLFKNITKSDSHTDASTVMKDSEGTPYSASVFVVNTTDIQEETNAVREGKVMNSLPNSQEDIVGWNEIFALMRRNYENKTKELKGLIPAESIRRPLDEDLDEDGLIVLEDLQHLNDFSSKIASDERVGVQTNERTEAPNIDTGSLDKKPGQSKSVTLATASIVGLAMVLFLLIFVGYRWRQQRASADDKNFSDERIPSPVFENRKGHKNNSSTRSISPMLSSNIYTLSTMDSQNGKESPDYMWDSLRKPFQ